MRSVVDRNVVMRCVTVLQWLGCGVGGRGPFPGGKGDFPFSAIVSKPALGLLHSLISHWYQAQGSHRVKVVICLH
jgi:hypothetical protein